MNTLVTGAPGWLASRLVEVLLDGFDGRGPGEDRQIVCLTFPGQEGALKKTFGDRITIQPADITRPESLNGIFNGVESVFHCAGIVHAPRVSSYYDVNTHGTLNLLERAQKAGVRRFIHVSTIAVSGFRMPPEALPMEERQTPQPYMHYGRSKYLAESAVLEASAKGKIEGVVVRPCWFYGPNQPERQTLFFRMIGSGRPLIFGDGDNLVSLCYIDNLVQGLLLAEKSSKAPGQIYGIADARPHRLIDVYQTIARQLGVKEMRVRSIPSFVADACYLADKAIQSTGLCIKEIHAAGKLNKNIVCSIEKARVELGYAPSIELEEGMARSVQWCRDSNQNL